MHPQFRKSLQIAVLSALTATSAHADFFGKLTETVNKVQQTLDSAKAAVDNTKEAVDSTKGASGNAEQTVTDTQKAVPQSPPKQNPQQQAIEQLSSQQAPSQIQSKNGVVVTEEYLEAREREVSALRKRFKFGRSVLSTAERAEIARVDQREQEINALMLSETRDAMTAFGTNKNGPGVSAELNNIRAKQYDSLHQLYSDALARIAPTDTAHQAQQNPPQGQSLPVQLPPTAVQANLPATKASTETPTRASNSDNIQTTLGIALGMTVTEVRNLLKPKGYILKNGPREGRLAAYVVAFANGDIPRDFKLNVHAVPVVIKADALTEQDLVVLALSGLREYEKTPTVATDSKPPTLNQALSYYQQTYGPMYSFQDGAVGFRPLLSFQSKLSIADAETPPANTSDPTSPITICRYALTNLVSYAGLLGSGGTAPEAILKNNVTSVQCSRMLEASFMSRGFTARDTPLSTSTFVYGDVHRSEEVFNAIINNQHGPGKTLTFAF